ncbi:MAG: hypothetical protein DRP29_08030 [Thermodesulfobacteriota bacterium]|nr:MAG: hypothetical protein DRP29_08030 [Thermodesulfobacteriota bacterium]
MKFRKYLLLFKINFLIFFIFHTAFCAPSQKFKITARKLEVLHTPKKILAEGDVIIQGENILIWAERVNYQLNTQYAKLENFEIFDFKNQIIIKGNVGFIDLRNDEIWADSVFIFLKKEKIRIKAIDFRKNALNEYFAKKAILTTCEMEWCGKICKKEKHYPAWSIEVEDFVLTSKGISKGKSTKFKIKKHTFIYLPKTAYIPKLSLPIGTFRKTGFLFPHIVQGNRLGVGLQIPFFWAVTDQIDFTIAPLYLSKRGFLFDIENQFRFTKDIQGLFKFRYLRDEWAESKYASEKEIKKYKWWIVGKVDYPITSNLDMHLDLDLVSEREFLEEFDVGEGGFSQSKVLFLQRFNRDIEPKTQEYRTSKFWIQYFRKSFYSRIETKYLDYHGFGDEDKILQPLFNIHFNFLPFDLFHKILTNFSLDYKYNYREEDYYGHRGNIKLEITYPFKIGYFMNSATFTYKNFFYNLENKGLFDKRNFNRNFYEIKLASYTYLVKKYLNFLHTLKPYLSFFYRREPSEKNVPQFDYEDAINSKAKIIEYGLWQFLSLPSQKNFIMIKTYQQYDFTKTEKSLTATSPEERAFSDIYFQINLNYSPYLFFRYDTAYNFYGLGFKKHSISFDLRNFIVDRLRIVYQKDTAWNTKQISFNLATYITNKIYTNMFITRNLIRDEFTERRIEINYIHKCYTLGFGIYTTPKDTKFIFGFQLKGLGGYRREF